MLPPKANLLQWSKKQLADKILYMEQQMNALEKLIPGRSTSSKSALIMSDIHIGDVMAPMSPDTYRADIGSYITPNRYAKAAWDFLDTVKDGLVRKVPTLLHINGEPFNGPHRKGMSSGVWSPNMGDQVKEASKFIRRLNFDNITGCKGSGYHVREGATDYEDMFFRQMNAAAYSGLMYNEIIKRQELYYSKQWDGPPIIKASEWDGPLIDNYLLFRMHGVVFSCAHHVQTNRNFAYKTTSIGREMAAMEFEAGKHYPKDAKPSVIIRSHTHYHVYAGYQHTLGMITPSWKFADDYIFKQGVGGSSPTIGAIEFIVESNGKYTFNRILMEQTEYPTAPVLEF